MHHKCMKQPLGREGTDLRDFGNGWSLSDEVQENFT